MAKKTSHEPEGRLLTWILPLQRVLGPLREFLCGEEFLCWEGWDEDSG